MTLKINSIERVATELGVSQRTVMRFLTDHRESYKPIEWPKGGIKRYYLSDTQFERLKIDFANRPRNGGHKNPARLIGH